MHATKSFGFEQFLHLYFRLDDFFPYQLHMAASQGSTIKRWHLWKGINLKIELYLHENKKYEPVYKLRCQFCKSSIVWENDGNKYKGRPLTKLSNRVWAFQYNMGIWCFELALVFPRLDSCSFRSDIPCNGFLNKIEHNSKWISPTYKPFKMNLLKTGFYEILKIKSLL